MGTWDIGPFDNDTAADFAGDLDESPREERAAMIRSVLQRAADHGEELITPDAERAVAAAALVVAQHPDGEPVCSGYGPSEPLPELPVELRTLAVDALDQVIAELSEIAELWDEVPDGPKWRQGVVRLRDVLDPPVPPIPPQEETLFDVEPVTDSPESRRPSSAAEPPDQSASSHNSR
ncbi:DUF4259 domain-containing protein [Streptomyces sp. NPDC026665]|uniref:DUF4259 domain-containing protein n=1 Tax=Streptomyces sp. NPDC026665 TaxID=3154798 RepID=UPI0033C98744